MTSRTDIMQDKDGWRRLSYTCRAGWVDWGHASAEGPARFKRNLIAEKSFPGNPLWHNVQVEIDTGMGRVPAFIIQHQEEMTKFGLTAKAGHLWAVQKGLTMQQREQVAFRIFMDTSMSFEAMQSSFPYVLFTDSGFSGEDLVSNLIGFYRAFRLNHIGRTDSTPVRRWLGEVSLQESLHIWDQYLSKHGGLGAMKNKTTIPQQFKTDACKGNCSFPPELASIRPAPTHSPLLVRLNALHYTNAQHQMRRDAVNVVDRYGHIKVMKAAA
jgi:hypothetical protein